jgi:tetratricopeptide (TPR) repeat protein
LLGAVHLSKLADANKELTQIQELQARLTETKRNYEANLVLIQYKIGQGLIRFKEGQKAEAIRLLQEAADMEDATEKHPVTPGEIIPARELLADLYFEMGDNAHALQSYMEDLERHPNRFNGLYGAAQSLEKMGNAKGAKAYYERLLSISASASGKRKDALMVKARGLLAAGQ